MSITEIARYLHLPLNKSFSSIKSQNHGHILANNRDCVGFLVKCEARLDSKELLKRERSFGLPLLVSVSAVTVELQMQAV